MSGVEILVAGVALSAASTALVAVVIAAYIIVTNRQENR